MLDFSCRNFYDRLIKPLSDPKSKPTSLFRFLPALLFLWTSLISLNTQLFGKIQNFIGPPCAPSKECRKGQALGWMDGVAATDSHLINLNREWTRVRVSFRKPSKCKILNQSRGRWKSEDAPSTKVYGLVGWMVTKVLLGGHESLSGNNRGNYVILTNCQNKTFDDNLPTISWLFHLLVALCTISAQITPEDEQRRALE